MSKKDQPHDRFFKDYMHNMEVVKAFLENYLSKNIQELIDWSTLAPYDTSLIGEKGKQLYADVLVRVMTKKGHEVFFILNHERKPDELLLVRMTEYTIGTLRRSVKQKQGKPAFIVPFTIYNGLKHPYPYPKEILDYYEDKELAKEMFLAGHRIIDLSAYSDEELASHGPLSGMELFMKHIDNPELFEWIRNNSTIIAELEKSTYLDRIIDYLIEAGHHSISDLENLFEEVSPKIKEGMLTTRQQIERKSKKEGKQEGKQEGIQEGIQKGIQKGIATKSFEVARYMLQESMPREKVSVWTGLDPEEIEKLVRELNLRI